MRTITKELTLINGTSIPAMAIRPTWAVC